MGGEGRGGEGGGAECCQLLTSGLLVLHPLAPPPHRVHLLHVSRALNLRTVALECEVVLVSEYGGGHHVTMATSML